MEQHQTMAMHNHQRTQHAVQSHAYLSSRQQRPNPSPSPRRPYPHGRGGAPAATVAEDHHPTNHIMQSRTSSHAHVLPKRNNRSRSRGKKSSRDREQHGHQSHAADNGASSSRRSPNQHRQSFREEDHNIGNVSSPSVMNSSDSAGMMMHDGKINEHGRCIRHPTIELACRDDFSQWRVLLQDCPLCSLSLDDPTSGGGLASLGIRQERVMHGGGGSHSIMSQATATPSTKTNRTTTTEEESSSVKSWTMSDASDSENEDDEQQRPTSRGRERSGRSTTPETLFTQHRPPPPPPPPKPAQNISMGTAAHQGYSNFQQQQHQQQQQYADDNFDPIQSLKELGKKLVMEQQMMNDSISFDDAWNDGGSVGMRSQASASVTPSMAGATTPRRPPPPPPPRGATNNNNVDNDNRRRESMSSMRESISSMSTKELSQIRQNSLRQQHQRSNVRPPPRRVTPSGVGGEGPADDSNQSILGEASDIIARMSSLTEGVNGSEENEAAREAKVRLAEEKAARAARRLEKREKKAAKLRAAREQQQQQQRQEQGGQTFEIPMNDTVSPRARSRGRGRASVDTNTGGDGPRATDDILQAAAQIRARARRSTSRSRERVKEAQMFCGETPSDDHDTDDHLDHISSTSEKRRSILNPHGLEEQPKPLPVERRSQSREKKRSGKKGRSQSRDRGKADDGISTRGRTRSGENGGSAYTQNNQPTSAEELLNRRREMRQKIAERRSNEQHRRVGSGGGQKEQEDENQSLKEEVLEGWNTNAVSQQSDAGSRHDRRARGRGEERSGRRGRSRSAVRDGLSKIRSASLKPFKKKGGGRGTSPMARGEYLSDEAGEQSNAGVQSMTPSSTSKQSAATSSSFKRLLSRGKPRSRSRGRGGLSLTDHDPNWAAKSEPFVTDDENDVKSTGAKSELSYRSRQSAGTSSSRGLGIFKKNKSISSSKGGLMRSLSRGSFRHIDRTEDDNNVVSSNGNRQSFAYDDKWDNARAARRSPEPFRQQQPTQQASWDEVGPMRSLSISEKLAEARSRRPSSRSRG